MLNKYLMNELIKCLASLAHSLSINVSYCYYAYILFICKCIHLVLLILSFQQGPLNLGSSLVSGATPHTHHPQPTPSPLPLQALLDFPSPNYKSGSADPGSVINKLRWAGLGVVTPHPFLGLPALFSPKAGGNAGSKGLYTS